VTCISRPGHDAYHSADVAIKYAAYNDVSALTDALLGHDVLIEAFNPAAAADQATIAEAALAAGVARIITPDFSGDTFHAEAAGAQIFAPKLAAQAALEEVVARSDGRLSWTAIIVGPWIDWCIGQNIFWINGPGRTVTRYGSGEQRVSLSRRDLCGEVLIEVLIDPERFRNRAAYFSSHTVTTNELIEVVQGLEPGWKVVDVPLEEYAAEARRLWDEDTRNGVKNRLGSQAYPMMATAVLMDEENRFGADFSDKAEPGWDDDGKDALKETLEEALGLAKTSD
jgi:hypothetical protein